MLREVSTPGINIYTYMLHVVYVEITAICMSSMCRDHELNTQKQLWRLVVLHFHRKTLEMITPNSVPYN